MEKFSKCYLVKALGANELILTGRGSDKQWEQANVLSDFTSPWDSEEIKKIEFRALWNQEKIFFCFQVADSKVYIDPSEDQLDSINNSDRVELFFRKDERLDPYYCLEIDPMARVMDFKARPNKEFAFNWNWPQKDIEVSTSVESDCFTVEIALSLSSLSDLGLLQDGKIEAGIYRAKYNEKDDGRLEPTWISWVDPKTQHPNFHIASSFGLLKLEDN